MKRWQQLNPQEVVRDVLNDSGFWGESLNVFPGFYNTVTEKLNLLMNIGAKDTIKSVQSKKEVVA